MLIHQDDDKLAFPNDITIEPETRKLYILMSNVPKLMYNKMDQNNKYYVHTASLDDLTHHCLS